jgi:hypothetical protein
MSAHIIGILVNAPSTPAAVSVKDILIKINEGRKSRHGNTAIIDTGRCLKKKRDKFGYGDDELPVFLK